MGKRSSALVATSLWALACSNPSPPARTAPPAQAVSVAPPVTASSGSGKPSPLSPFPQSVGGFPFGASPEKFVELCRAAGWGGRVLDGRHAAVCTGTAVRMPFEVRKVTASFCGEHACEYALSARPGPEIAAALLRQLVARYGPAEEPGTSEVRCQADPPSRRLLWTWPGAANRASILRLVFDCAEDEVPEERAATLYYDDEAGTAWRLGRQKNPDSSF